MDKIIKKYKHFSFDLDGTLVHTTKEYRQKIVPKIINHLGGIFDETSIDKFWFECKRDITIERDFKVDPSQFWSLFRKYDTPLYRSKHTYAYEDSIEFLRILKKHGKKISIVTGAPAWIADMEIKKLKGSKHDFYLSIHNGPFKEKPDPESLHHTIERLKVGKHETVYIGNSKEDANYAKNANVDFIYLNRNEYNENIGISMVTINSLKLGKLEY